LAIVAVQKRGQAVSKFMFEDRLDGESVTQMAGLTALDFRGQGMGRSTGVLQVRPARPFGTDESELVRASRHTPPPWRSQRLRLAIPIGR